MRGNPLYVQYSPNQINPIKYNKGFLLNLIAFIDSELFKILYATQKKQLLEKSFNM